MKKPITIIFNDIHIKNGNEDSVYEGVKHLVEYANKVGVKEVILNGDVFDSRSFQRLSHLKCFENILELFRVNGILCHTNVGNHDKTLYNSVESFLDAFKYHPSIKLYPKIEDVKIMDKIFTFSPFFEDSILCKQLEEHSGTDVLIGHWSCDGSTYLGKTDENKVINKKLLSKWDKVYLGHYHNYHEVNSNTTHLPSLLQDNFGEDNIKGFSVIYDDLSYEVIKGKFKEFKKVVIDLNETSIQSIKELIKNDKNSSNVVRFEFIGEESKLKSLDKSIFKDTGIDVKLKYDKKYDFNDSNLEMPKITEVFTKKDIEEDFKSFCDKKDYDHNYGKTLLKKFFDGK